MSDTTALLFANEAFYAAFATCDLAAMNDVWSQDSLVTCIHPGWKPLQNRREVMASWKTILGGHDCAPVQFADPEAVLGSDMAYVTCIELVGDARLAATNIFRLEEGRWRMVHHQAGTLAMAVNEVPEETGPAPGETVQ